MKPPFGIGEWINRFPRRSKKTDGQTFVPDDPVAQEPTFEAEEHIAMDIVDFPVPHIDLPNSAYTDSKAYLWDHLRRVDLLVRAYAIRWLNTIGKHKSADQWGMLLVPETEMIAYLRSSVMPPDDLPDDLSNQIDRYREWAEMLEASIRESREMTNTHLVKLRLHILDVQFDLPNHAQDVLLIALLGEVDERYRRLFGCLQDDATRTRPSIDLIAQIMRPIEPDTAYIRSLFDAQGALQKAHLIKVDSDQRTDLPPASQSVQVDERIVSYLLEQDDFDERDSRSISRQQIGLDERLLRGVSISQANISLGDLFCEEEQRQRLQCFKDWLTDPNPKYPITHVILFLHGLYGSGRLKAAQALCNDIGYPLLIIQAEQLLRSGQSWELLVDLVYREAQLRGTALYWAGCEKLIQAEQPPYIWDYLITAAESYIGLTFLASEETWEPVNHFRNGSFTRLDFPMPHFTIRKKIWLAELQAEGDFLPTELDRDGLAAALANSFQLTEGQIKNAVVTARGFANRRNPAQPFLTTDDFYTGCRLQSSQRLMSMARRVEPRTNLKVDNLVLPSANKKQLRELKDRILYRNQVYSGLGFEQRLSLGKGLIVLFTGSSGTGKTMAAEALAREQGVDLYKVDLSSVVSKWVGDTEKNLSKVFSEAEYSNATIFFDEADALFGKRGDVKEAQDRWANLEVNYLLQRIEEYTGVVIMASNLGQNIDQAFMRRIHMIVDFPFPDADARLKIWQGMFPEGLSHPSDTELQVLATRFKLAGGSIKNIVVDAAFRAVVKHTEDQQPTTITQRHLVMSTAREYQKQGKPITRGDFGDPFYSWIQEDIL